LVVTTDAAEQDIAALAKGGRTNVTGFALRLIDRLPFHSGSSAVLRRPCRPTTGRRRMSCGMR
jgi:hypothetical protein